MQTVLSAVWKNDPQRCGSNVSLERGLLKQRKSHRSSLILLGTFPAAPWVGVMCNGSPCPTASNWNTRSITQSAVLLFKTSCVHLSTEAGKYPTYSSPNRPLSPVLCWGLTSASSVPRPNNHDLHPRGGHPREGKRRQSATVQESICVTLLPPKKNGPLGLQRTGFRPKV